jgi:hypothetical protein
MARDKTGRASLGITPTASGLWLDFESGLALSWPMRRSTVLVNWLQRGLPSQCCWNLPSR